jgi:hypothetical protein
VSFCIVLFFGFIPVLTLALPSRRARFQPRVHDPLKPSFGSSSHGYSRAK